MGKNDSSRSDPELARYYEERFVEYLEACARHRFGRDSEPFLLQARRALEAAVYAVYAGRVGTPPAKPLHDLLSELSAKGLLAQPRRHDFEAIRARTNRAAHVPKPRDLVDTKDADKVARDLGDIAEWLAEHRMCGDYADSVRHARDHIAGKPALTAPDVELARLREQVLIAEQGARAVREHDLRRELEGGGRAGSTERRTEGRAPALWPGLAAVVALAFVAGAGAGWMLSGREAREPVPTMVAESDAVGRDDAASGVRTDAGGPTTSAAPLAERDAGASEARDCPEGMELVEGGTLRLRPPSDREWAAAGRRPVDHEVAPFCIASHLVTRRDYRECVASGACAAITRCRDTGAAGAPASCISQGDAGAYCRWRLEDEAARLPSIIELEHVARTTQVDLVPAASASTEHARYEWSSDTCPSAALGGRPTRRPLGVHASMGRLEHPDAEPRPRLSWHCPPPVGSTLHNFRCVVPPMRR